MKISELHAKMRHDYWILIGTEWRYVNPEKPLSLEFADLKVRDIDYDEENGIYVVPVIKGEG